MNSVLKSADGKDLILTCTCGCEDAIHFRIDTVDPNYYFWMTYMNSNWYRDQNHSVWGVFRTKLKKIWRIIRNKDHHYSDIIMAPEDFELFREYVNSVSSDSTKPTGMADEPRTSHAVSYICDKLYCESCDNPECKHTTDITHAANFINLGGNEWMEKED